MAEPIRLVVTDVDGTLVREDKTLAPSTIAAAARLRAAGIRLALVSSRPAHGLDVLLAPLAIDTPRAGFNGGEVLSPDGAVLDERLIPEAACRRAVERLEAWGLDVWVFGGGAWFLKDPGAPYVPREQLSVGMSWQVVEDFAPHFAGVHKVMASSRDFAAIARGEAELAALMGRAASVHRSQPYYIDVTHPKADKGTAACDLARLLGVDPMQMACLGDMPNDVPMLRVAGLAIAMGNAPAEVRAAAHEVTGTNEADGWAQAMERFVLPRASH